MDEKINQMEEINTGLTMAMEQYQFSESTPYQFHQSAAGTSRTHQHTHPERQPAFQSPSVSSLRDTESASTWNYRIRGKEGSEETAGGAAEGAAEGADGGEGAGDPPPPPDPPSDHGGAGGQRMSR